MRWRSHEEFRFRLIDTRSPQEGEACDDGRLDIATTVAGDFLPRRKITAAEVLVAEALLDGFIRY
jgi:hypothetical protein